MFIDYEQPARGQAAGVSFRPHTLKSTKETQCPGKTYFYLNFLNLNKLINGAAMPLCN